MAAEVISYLNFDIGGAIHRVPIFDSYNDFYNKKYIAINLFNNKTGYVNISPAATSLSINAGAEQDGIKYYILSKAFTTSENFIDSGTVYKHISGSSSRYDLSKILTCTVTVPQAGWYKPTFSIYWMGSYNAHHDYRWLSSYRFQTRFGDKVLTDTGLLSLATSRFYPYSTPTSSEEGLAQEVKYMSLGSGEYVYLEAGQNNLDLYMEMYEEGNKHAAAYVKDFAVSLSYALELEGKKCVMYTTAGSYTFKVPDGVTKVTLVAIGGGGGSAVYGYDYESSSGEGSGGEGA